MTAKKQLMTNSTMSALSTDKEEMKKCTSCNKVHSRECLKVKNATALNQSKLCSICKKAVHKYKTKASGEGILKII